MQKYLVSISSYGMELLKTNWSALTIISWSFSIAFLISSPIASSGHFKSSLHQHQRFQRLDYEDFYKEPHISRVIHEGEEVIIDPNQLVVLALHIRHLHVVGGRADVLKLFAWKSIAYIFSSHILVSPVKMSRATM